MSRTILLLLCPAIALAACSGDDARPDAGTPADGGSTADAGQPADAGPTTDAGQITDAGEPDAGQAPEAQVVLQLRDLDLSVFGSDVISSVILARPAAVYPSTGCAQRADGQPSLPSIGAIDAQGLTVTGLSCSDDVGTGIDGTRCLSQGAGPPPIPGSTLDTGPWLTAAEPTLSVAGGADLGALSATLAPPSEAADITAPTALPTTIDGDLTVQWGALGHLDVQIEVEVMLGGGAATVVCAPDEDGQVVVPEALLGDRILRISVANYAQTVVRDAQERGLIVQVMRGRVIGE